MPRIRGGSAGCEWFREMVRSRGDETLDDARRAALDSHLEACDSCRAYSERYAATLDAVVDYVNAPAPEGLARRAVAAAAASTTPPPMRRYPMWGGRTMLKSQAIRMGAMLAAMAAVIFVMRSRHAPEAKAEECPGQLEILDKSGKPAGLCPLKHTDVVADIAGYVARVTVKQEFVNPSKTPIEAVYTFPLPEDAAVDDMTMRIGSRVIRGKIMRREEARETYEAARERGQGAALLDQERPNIFTQSVANIMPGDSVVIEISYVNLLKYKAGIYEFVFPMVVGPRYTPGGGYTVPGQRGEPSPAQTAPEEPGNQAVVTDADKITPPIAPKGTRAGHSISLTVNVDAGLPLQQVAAVLHEVDVRRQGPNRATVRLRDRDEIPNRDFVLRYSAAGSQVQEGLLTYASGQQGEGGFFTLILQPPMAPPQETVSPKEMVFVIDQTGSQEGWPIQKAKETMRYCIQHLNPGDTFQLIGFNTDVFPCFPAPVEATPESVQTALRYLDGIEAGGGTDILKAADYALSLPEDPERLRVVCFMTDGYVGDDMQIVQYVREHRGTTRMFPFGIGDSVNRFLIEGMAKEGRGAPEFVTLEGPGAQAAQRFAERVASPLLLDVQVDWGGLPVEDVYPKQIPDVFSSGPVILKGRYSRAAEGDVTIRGLLRGQPWTRTIHVVLPDKTSEGSAIATLWARERIEDIQSQDWVGAQTGQPKTDTKEQIIETAQRYRLMSQYTSFVAVEERVVNPTGQQQKVDVPVEMPHGVSHTGIFGGEDEGVEKAKSQASFASKSVFFSRSRYPAAMAGRPSLGGMSVPNAPAATSGPPARSSSYQPSAAAAKTSPAAPAYSGRQKAMMNLHWAVSQYTQDYDDVSRARAATRLALADLASHRPLADLAIGKPAAYRTLASLKPRERAGVLEQAKLSDSLRRLLAVRRGEKAPQDGIKPPPVTAGRVDVVIWLNPKAVDALKALQQAGFVLTSESRPGKVLRGTIAVERLDALLALPSVRRVEPAR